MLSKYGAEDVSTEAASGEGGDEHVGIKTDAHDLGDSVEDILIREIAAGLSERHGLTARVLKLEDRELAAERIASDIAARSPGAFGELGELALECAIEANRQGGRLHV